MIPFIIIIEPAPNNGSFLVQQSNFNVYQLIFIKLFYIRIHFHFTLYENKATIKEGI